MGAGGCACARRTRGKGGSSAPASRRRDDHISLSRMRITQLPNLTIIDHPLIRHKLAVLRSRETSKQTFRELVDEISMLMGYEVTKALPLEDVDIETPLERTVAQMVSGKKLTLVPILRAGL